MRVTAQKDRAINDVLERLRADLGDASFTLVDYWDGDLCAVGVARPDDSRHLVYISTWPPGRGTFTYECERPSTDPGLLYESDGMVEHVSYEALRAAVQEHLRR